MKSYQLELRKMNLFKNYFLKVKYVIRMYLGEYPLLFFPINKYTKGRNFALDKNTELVIEGFQRSANTFCVEAIRSAQPSTINIASHLHVPAHVILATRKNLPILVLIRNPVDAALSHYALMLEGAMKASRPSRYRVLWLLFKHYIFFYTKIMPYRDKYVIGLFEDVTTNFGSVIEKINQRFGTEFSKFDHTPENVKKVFNQSGFHAGSTAEREALKLIVREEFETELKSAKFKLLVSQAEEVYRQFKLLAREGSPCKLV